jgi:hypothetical protein
MITAMTGDKSALHRWMSANRSAVPGDLSAASIAFAAG